MVVKWSYALANAAPVLVGTWRLGKSHLLPTSTVHMQPIRRVRTSTGRTTTKFAGRTYPWVAPLPLSHLSPVVEKEDDIQLSLVAQGKTQGRSWTYVEDLGAELFEFIERGLVGDAVQQEEALAAPDPLASQGLQSSIHISTIGAGLDY